MKIVITVSSATYWQPQAEQFAAAMMSLGHDVRTVTSQTIDALPPGDCDLLFCLATTETLAGFLTRIPASRKIMYLLESIPTPAETDEFTRRKLNVHLSYLNDLDYVFVHTRRSIPMLQSLGVVHAEELLWPHFPAIFSPDAAVAQDIDLLFLGAPSQHRSKYLDQLRSRFKLAIGNGMLHQNARQMYARAKIVLNIHYTPLSNFECRVTEVLGCGGFLMSEALDPADVLIDGEQLVIFDETSLVSLTEHFLKAADQRQRISIAGNAAIQRYTVTNQVNRIVEVAEHLLHTT